MKKLRFNPLDRGNLYQISKTALEKFNKCALRFNPLDRGNLYQMALDPNSIVRFFLVKFQSPRSGKFVSDKRLKNSI